MSSGARGATTVVYRHKIALWHPVAWSSYPVGVNKMSQMHEILMQTIFIHSVAK